MTLDCSLLPRSANRVVAVAKAHLYRIYPTVSAGYCTIAQSSEILWYISLFDYFRDTRFSARTEQTPNLYHITSSIQLKYFVMSDFNTEPIVVEFHGKIAVVTLNQPKKLNALDQDLYYRLAQILREIEARPEIFITLLTGSGRFFSA
jgi:Enoyl-CoA hydratase/isomerase